ncbi:MAG TPA: cysteine desulfurase family protein [Thermomicrobiales bacterium]|nr:cysteine desulfurase family protein [Thermomicrobiales bacterium]
MEHTDIYLDHAATTPVDPRVLEVMLPFFSTRYGNPSSVYDLGRDARAAIDWARATLAGALNCAPGEIIMTSGATESDNLAVKGVAWWHRANRPERNRILVSAIEHHAVLHAAEAMREHGFAVDVVQPDADGILQPDAVGALLSSKTCLVSVMLANNEIGTIQPIREIAALARDAGAVVHTDAVQAAGALPLDVEEFDIDLLSLSAHKFYGPKGVGLLYCRRQTPMAWQQHGGAQEDTRRAGTENTPGIVGMAAALLLAVEEMDARTAHCRELRDRLIDGILERVPDARLNGDAERRLPNNVNLAFAGVDGDALLVSLDLLGIAASSGSACTTGSTEPSHVITALGVSPELARGSLRLTVGKDNTLAEIDRAIRAVAETVERVRTIASVSG